MLSDLVMAARDDGDFNQDRYDKLLGELRVLSTKDSDEAPAADTGDNSAETTDAEDYGFEPLTLDFGLGGDAEETSFDAGLDAGKKIYDILPDLSDLPPLGSEASSPAMLNECVMESDAAREPSVISGLDEFKQLTRDLQESVMAIRAQPVQPLFQRMSRIVREAADATNKTARLVLEGEFTEVDKTIVEKLADPLTHMIRNAIDHGLEMPEERLAKGKPAEGIIKLSAAHRSGKIVIEVSDDGGGINRERVKKIAIEKGLISTDTVLTDSEIDNLLFMAGFSTVEKVSTLSGRGVGMDVVKRAIQSIGGRITISSEPDKGSTFTINLPLTLAVLDGMLVQVCGQTLVVPRSLPMPPNQIDSIDGEEYVTFTIDDQEYCINIMSLREIRGWTPATPLPDAPPYVRGVINLRGSVLPIIDLAKRLDLKQSAPTERSVVMITQIGTQVIGLLADAVSDILTIDPNMVQTPPDLAPGAARSFIQGLVALEDRMVSIISLENILSDVDREAA